MKKSSLLRCAALLPLFVILFASCSKDTLKEPQSSPLNSERIGGLQLPQIGHPVIAVPQDQPGSIQAEVTWFRTTVSMTAYNRTYTSVENYADRDGIVTVDGLTPGFYTVVIHVYDANMKDKVITNVEVSSGKITDLGNISYY
jgi:hypothetical protein